MRDPLHACATRAARSTSTTRASRAGTSQTQAVTASAVLRDAMRCMFQRRGIDVEVVDKLADYWQQDAPPNAGRHGGRRSPTSPRWRTSAPRSAFRAEELQSAARRDDRAAAVAAARHQRQYRAGRGARRACSTPSRKAARPTDAVERDRRAPARSRSALPTPAATSPRSSRGWTTSPSRQRLFGVQSKLYPAGSQRADQRRPRQPRQRRHRADGQQPGGPATRRSDPEPTTTALRRWAPTASRSPTGLCGHSTGKRRGARGSSVSSPARTMRTSPARWTRRMSRPTNAADPAACHSVFFSLEIGDAELKAAVLQTSFRDYKVAALLSRAGLPTAPRPSRSSVPRRARRSRRHDSLGAARRQGHLAHVLPAVPRPEEARRRPFPSSSRAASLRSRRGRRRLPDAAPRPRRHDRCWRRWCRRRISSGISSCCRTSGADPEDRRHRSAGGAQHAQPRSRSSADLRLRRLRAARVTVALYRERELVGLRTPDPPRAPAAESNGNGDERRRRRGEERWSRTCAGRCWRSTARRSTRRWPATSPATRRSSTPSSSPLGAALPVDGAAPRSAGAAHTLDARRRRSRRRRSARASGWRCARCRRATRSASTSAAASSPSTARSRSCARRLRSVVMLGVVVVVLTVLDMGMKCHQLAPAGRRRSTPRSRRCSPPRCRISGGVPNPKGVLQRARPMRCASASTW